jgi:hypothetical protein
VQEGTQGSQSSACDYPVFPGPIVEEVVFFPTRFWHLYQESSTERSHMAFSGPCIHSIAFCVCFYANFTMLFLLLWLSSKSEIHFVILFVLDYCSYLRSSELLCELFFIVMKNTTGILLVIPLTLQITFSNMAILTILNLPIRAPGGLSIFYCLPQ